MVIGANRRIFIWRRKDEAESADCVCPPSQKKNSVMIWGCITYHGVGTISILNGIINRHKYIEILEDNLWPVISRHFPTQNFLFQDDNAPIHRAHDVEHYKARNRIQCLSWPAQSPDLNPIENVWLKIKNRLQQHVENIKSVEEPSDSIIDIWQTLPMDYIQSLYNSLPRRIRKVIGLKVK